MKEEEEELQLVMSLSLVEHAVITNSFISAGIRSKPSSSNNLLRNYNFSYLSSCS